MNSRKKHLFLPLLLAVLFLVSCTPSYDNIVDDLQRSSGGFVISDDDETASDVFSTPVPEETVLPEETGALEPERADIETPPSSSPTADQEEYRSAILSGLKSTNILRYIPADTYVREENVNGYDAITADPAHAYSLQVQYGNWFSDATASLLSLEIQSVSTDCTAPSWQMLNTLAYNYSGDPDGLSEALLQACEFKITGSASSSKLTITAKPRNPSSVFYGLPTRGKITPFINTLTYAYLSTIYDESMQVRDGIGTPGLEEFLFPITNPSAWYFDDTWYADRDGGSRRHAGTDINAPEGTDLLACVNGTILDAGTSQGAGNYIVVEGKDGTQYHYYHMVNPSDLSSGQDVTRGDVVGHVGDTGNSAANHLHFTIVNADGYYLNPYTYLKDAQKRAIAG